MRPYRCHRTPDATLSEDVHTSVVGSVKSKVKCIKLISFKKNIIGETHFFLRKFKI